MKTLAQTAMDWMETHQVKAQPVSRGILYDAVIKKDLRFTLWRDPYAPHMPAQLWFWLMPVPWDARARRRVLLAALTHNHTMVERHGLGLRLDTQGEYIVLDIIAPETLVAPGRERPLLSRLVSRALALQKSLAAHNAAPAVPDPRWAQVS